MIKLLFCLCILAVFIVFYAIRMVVDAGKKAVAKVTGEGEKERFTRMAETAYKDVKSVLESTALMGVERGVELSPEDVNDCIVRPVFQNFFDTYPAEDMVKIAVGYAFYKQAQSESVQDAIYAAAVPLIRAIRQRGEAYRLPEAWGGTVSV